MANVSPTCFLTMHLICRGRQCSCRCHGKKHGTVPQAREDYDAWVKAGKPVDANGDWRG